MMDFLAYANPYSGTDFWQFFAVLARRVGLFVLGQGDALASDEIQLLVLSGVALSCALVGVFLVLRQMSMLANALSHTVLFGIVIAYLVTGTSHAGGHGVIDFKAMLLAALATGVATTFLTEFLHKKAGVQEDASIGFVFTSLFALGILLVTVYTRNAHIGTEVVLGNADALHVDDVGLVWKIFLGDALLCVLFFKEYKITAFDGGYAKALGISTVFFNYLIMVQLAATAIGAFRAVGVIMVLALIVGPPLTARLLTNRLSVMLALSMTVGAASAIFGVALARHFLSVRGAALSTGALVVVVTVALFLMGLLCAPQRGLLARFLHRWSLTRKLVSIKK